MPAKVTDTDHGLARVGAALAKKWRVRVGILSDEPKREHDGETGPYSLLEVAALHEFGAPPHIPQRSFIRATVDQNIDVIHELQLSQAKLIAALKTDGATAMERIGAKVKALIQTRIAQGIDPPNAEITIERKGSSKPLIDTGQLRSSIAYVVEKLK